MPKKATTNEHWSDLVVNLGKVLVLYGIVIGRRSPEAARCLREADFRVFDLVAGLMLAIAPYDAIVFNGKQVVFVSALA